MTAAAPKSSAPAAPAIPAVATLKLIDITKIKESPFNPRKNFEKEALNELTADIAAKGILQPLIVRPMPNTDAELFEVVVGHRRLRGGKAAGLKEVPCLVRVLTDAQAQEINLTEQDKREDLTPLERAHGYKQLMDVAKLNQDQLAQRLGKSRSTIYATLALLNLSKKAIEAMESGKLSLNLAQIVSTVDPSMQDKATADILTGRYGKGGPMTTREAKEWVEENFRLDLKSAPFPLDDKELKPCGACSTCPNNTAVNKERYPESTSALCASPTQYREKAAFFAKREADARGLKLLQGKAAEKIVNGFGEVVSADHVSAKEKCAKDADERSYGQLLTKEAKAELGSIVVTAKGDIVEVYVKDGMTAALKASGKLKPPKESKAEERFREEAASAREERQRAQKVYFRTVEEIVAKAEDKGIGSPKIVDLLVRVALVNGSGVFSRRLAKDTEGSGPYTPARMAKAFGELTAKQKNGLLVECILEWALESPDFQREACAVFGLDLKDIVKSVKQAEKDAERVAAGTKGITEKKAEKAA